MRFAGAFDGVFDGVKGESYVLLVDAQSLGHLVGVVGVPGFRKAVS